MKLRTLLSLGSSFLLLIAASQAGAVSITVGFDGNPGSFVTMTDQTAGLGCSPAGDLGQMSCTGSNLDNGGWTLDSWDLFADPDPTINNTVSVTNNTVATQSFSIMVSLPVIPAFGPPSLIRGSIQGGATDNNGDGVTLSSSGAASFYEALIDGTPVRTLLDPAQSFSTGLAFDSVSVGLVNYGIPVQEVLAIATTTSIGINLRFDLTAGDSATFSSVFNVEPIPEPGTALLLGLGLTGLALKRRD